MEWACAQQTCAQRAAPARPWQGKRHSPFPGLGGGDGEGGGGAVENAKEEGVRM